MDKIITVVYIVLTYLKKTKSSKLSKKTIFKNNECEKVITVCISKILEITKTESVKYSIINSTSISNFCYYFLKNFKYVHCKFLLLIRFSEKTSNYFLNVVDLCLICYVWVLWLCVKYFFAFQLDFNMLIQQSQAKPCISLFNILNYSIFCLIQ